MNPYGMPPWQQLLMAQAHAQAQTGSTQQPAWNPGSSFIALRSSPYLEPLHQPWPLGSFSSM